MEEILDIDSDIDEEEVELTPPPPASASEDSFPYTFDGIKVLFPYKAYKSQVQMMVSITKALNASQHCLLESPTGTGKTAAVLCPALAWQKHHKEKNPNEPPPIIIYASRTHSQLNQAADQLNKSPYRKTPMTILAGRVRTCLNEYACASGSRDEACATMRNNYYHPRGSESPDPVPKSHQSCSRYEQFKQTGSQFETYISKRVSCELSVVWDLEELVRVCDEINSCAFYEGKAMKEKALIIFCNYNHLLHPWIRKAQGIELEGNIVILDEGHNIEDNCMRIASRKILLEKLEKTIIPKLNEASEVEDIPDVKQDPLRRVQVAFTDLCNWMRSQLESQHNSEFTQLGDILVKKLQNPVEVFFKIGFSPEVTKQLYKDCLILEDRHYGQEHDPKAVKFKVDGAAMRAIKSILFTFHVLYGTDGDPTGNGNGVGLRLNHYSIDLVKSRRGNLNHGSEPFELTLNLNCLSPHVIFADMQRAQTVIVTSGTLSPMRSFSSELGVQFHHQVSASHVLGSDRVFAAVISRYEEEHKSVTFKFNYKTLSQAEKYEMQARCLGQLLIDICQKIKFGVLVFFPSKTRADRFKKTWETDGTLKKLSESKRTFFEHETAPTALQDLINEYKSCAASDGAVMFAILRGRISEGIDFADNHARAVISVGIPYANFKELPIARKMDYNNSPVGKQRGLLGGFDWYRTNAFRAVNQGLGRCVRHRQDWGVIFMVDERYDESASMISTWVWDAVRTGSTLENLEAQLDAFMLPLIKETGPDARDSDVQAGFDRQSSVRDTGEGESSGEETEGRSSDGTDCDCHVRDAGDESNGENSNGGSASIDGVNRDANGSDEGSSERVDSHVRDSEGGDSNSDEGSSDGMSAFRFNRLLAVRFLSNETDSDESDDQVSPVKKIKLGSLK